MAQSESLSSPPAGPSAPARFFSRRTAWHTLGIVLAAIIAWLLMLAYRQPEFMLDFVNLRLC